MGDDHYFTSRVGAWLRTARQKLSGPGAAAASRLYELNAAEAERLKDGSLVFGSEDRTREKASKTKEWWIFSRLASQREETSAIFILRGVVPAEGTAEEFLCSAYSHVLDRDVDAEGRRAFTDLLASGKSTSSSVLRSLLTSEEARKKDNQFVVVEKPSRWLPQEASLSSRVWNHKVFIRGLPTTRTEPSPLQIYPGYGDEDRAIFEEFRDPMARAQRGFIVDFLGGRIRTSSLARSVRHLDGQLLGIPVPSDYHAEAIEWIGLLKSVKTARRGEYVAMELGAGFGPWSIAGGLAARQKGIVDIRLCSVEADPQHFQSLRQNYLDNGFNPECHTLIEAAVGVDAGVVRWPAFADSSDDWGSRPMLAQSAQDPVAQDYLGRTFAETIAVNIVPMVDLLRREPEWDLVHIDVQGTEVEIVESGIDELNARVHWLVIGTHSRKLEGDLIEILVRAGWILEHEKPAKFNFQSGAASLEAMTTLDGTQVWRNPRRALM